MPLQAFLLLSTFHIGRSVCGEGSTIIGKALDVSLDFETPKFTAAFALTVVTAVFTFYQLTIVVSRFKKPTLPEGAIGRHQYRVGILFPILLTLYILSFLVWTILYSIFLAYSFAKRDELNVRPSFVPGMWFVEQVANITFLAMLLHIVSYRQRIQLNPRQCHFLNVKAIVDGLILAVIAILGLAMIGMQSVRATDYHAQSLAIPGMRLAYAICLFIGNLNVTITAIMSHIRLENINCNDDIIRIAAHWIPPFILIGGIYRIVESGLLTEGVRLDGLLAARAVIIGLVSVAVAGLALSMGAPPKPLTEIKQTK